MIITRHEEFKSSKAFIYSEIYIFHNLTILKKKENANTENKKANDYSCL